MCCYNKKIEEEIEQWIESSQVSLDEDAKAVLDIDDPTLEIGQEYLIQTPVSKYDQGNLNALGQDLASSGYSELAIKYLEKAIAIEPKEYSSWLNSLFLFHKTQSILLCIIVCRFLFSFRS